MNKIKISVIVVLAIMILSSLMLVNNTNVNNTNVSATKDKTTFSPASTVNSDYWNTSQVVYSDQYNTLNIQNTLANLNSGSINVGGDIPYYFNFTTETININSIILNFTIEFENPISAYGSPPPYVYVGLIFTNITIYYEIELSDVDTYNAIISINTGNLVNTKLFYFKGISFENYYSTGVAGGNTFTDIYSNNNVQNIPEGYTQHTGITGTSGNGVSYNVYSSISKNFAPILDSGYNFYYIDWSSTIDFTLYINNVNVSYGNNIMYNAGTSTYDFNFSRTLTTVQASLTVKIYDQRNFGNYVLPQFAPYTDLSYNSGNISMQWQNNSNENLLFLNSINANINLNNFLYSPLLIINNLTTFNINFSYISTATYIYFPYIQLFNSVYSYNNISFNNYNKSLYLNANQTSTLLFINRSNNNLINNKFYFYNNWNMGFNFMSITPKNANSQILISPYKFSYVKYPVFFNESQFPIGSQWQLTIGGHTYTSTTNSIELNLTTGDYPYSASFGAFTANGNEVISGTNYVKNILLQFKSQATYYLTIDTNNYNNYYNVVIGGSSYSIIDNNNLIPIFNGTYSVNAKVNGYSIVYPSQITITGNKTIYFNFTATNRYLTFVESGLYIGVSWTVNVNNTNYNSIGNEISIWLSQTNYNYVVSAINDYTVSPASGAIDLTSNTTIDIVFTHYPFLTINVVGYQQNYPYTFSINSNTYTFTNSNNVIVISSGTYNYVFNFNENFTWTNGNIVINSNMTLTENVNVKVYHLIFNANIPSYNLILNNNSYIAGNIYYYNTTNHLLQYSAHYSSFIVKYSESSLSYNVNQTIYINFTKLYEFILVSEIDTTWSVIYNNHTYINDGNIVILSANNTINIGINDISGYTPVNYTMKISSNNIVSITQINFTSANNIQSEQFNMISLMPYLIIFMFIIFVGVIGFIRKRGKDE